MSCFSIEWTSSVDISRNFEQNRENTEMKESVHSLMVPNVIFDQRVVGGRYA